MFGNTIRGALAVIACAVFFVSSANGAFMLGFDGVANNDPDNVAAGEAQLMWSAEELDGDPMTGPTRVAFTIFNMGDEPMTITRIYFDAEAFESIDSTASMDDGVAFGPNIGPPNMPAGRNIGFNSRDGLRVGALPPGPKNGVNPGESVTVVVELKDGYTFLDTLIGLNDGSIRLGLHVQSFEDGGSESFVNVELPEELIPTPGAATLLGLSGVLLLRRRR
jgi:uncharacterized protein (TIGR03382 family)